MQPAPKQKFLGERGILEWRRFGRDKDWRETAGRERMQSMQVENIGTGGMPKMMLSAYRPLMEGDITRQLLKGTARIRDDQRLEYISS